MDKILRLKVDDLVVRNGKVLKVFKVSQNTVSLRPFFHSRANNSLTFTLNLNQDNNGHIRKLISKTKLKQLLSQIINKTVSGDCCPAYNAASALNNNQLKNTLWTIKTLWLEKQEKSDILPGGKLTTFRQAMLQATEEIAAINHTSPDQAKLLLLSGLKSSLPTN